jgi:hypothetical protein
MGVATLLLFVLLILSGIIILFGIAKIVKNEEWSVKNKDLFLSLQKIYIS